MTHMPNIDVALLRRRTDPQPPARDLWAMQHQQNQIVYPCGQVPKDNRSEFTREAHASGI